MDFCTNEDVVAIKCFVEMQSNLVFHVLCCTVTVSNAAGVMLVFFLLFDAKIR